MRCLVVVGLIAALPNVALAEDTRYGAPVSRPERDPDDGLHLSIVGSTAPLVLFAAGMNEKGTPRLATAGLALGIVTPSLGEFYGGRYLTYGMAARATGFALMVIGWQNFEPICWSPCSYAESERPRRMMLGGAILYLGGMIYDIATAPGTVRRWNERQLAIAPLAGPVNGVALSGRF